MDFYTHRHANLKLFCMQGIDASLQFIDMHSDEHTQRHTHTQRSAVSWCLHCCHKAELCVFLSVLLCPQFSSCFTQSLSPSVSLNPRLNIHFSWFLLLHVFQGQTETISVYPSFFLFLWITLHIYYLPLYLWDILFQGDRVWEHLSKSTNFP